MLRSVRRGGGEGGGGGGPFQPSQKLTRQLSLFNKDVGKEEGDEEERALFDSFIFCHAGKNTKKKNTKKNTKKKKYAREVHRESFVGGCPSSSSSLS